MAVTRSLPAGRVPRKVAGTRNERLSSEKNVKSFEPNIVTTVKTNNAKIFIKK